MPAQDFPFYWPYKNSNIINLNFGVTIVAVDLMLLMKIKIKLLILFAPRATTRKLIEIKILIFDILKPRANPKI